MNLKDDGSAPLVVLMCGAAGSGKTTLAIQLEEKGFVRLSIDEEIWAHYGRFGVDYPREKYEEYSEEVEKKLRAQLVGLIHERKQIVVDFSFWQRVKREEYKKLIEEAGAEWRLLFLKVDDDVLRARLQLQSSRFDANAAFPITEDLLTSYLNGFEEPWEEGEIIIGNK